ncbi:MAG: hypothetical protein ABSA03_17065 [Streptosporangiaceae bacterium]
MARALLGALAAGVLPGYFWAGFLRPAGGLGERLAYSAAISMASVPVLAIAQARLLGTGVTLAVGIVSILVVLGSGALALVLRGAPDGPAGPVLPAPAPIRDWRVLALIVVAFGLALASELGAWTRSWLLLVIPAVLLAAGVLAVTGNGVAGFSAVANGDGLAGDRPGGDRTGTGRDGTGGDRTGGDGTGTGRDGTGGTGDVAGGDGGGTGGAGPRAAGTWTAGSRAVPTGATGTLAGAQPAAPRAAGAHAARAHTAGARTAWQPGTVLREPVLAVILLLTAVRAYAGPIRHDWPYIRGGDQFSHAVMAEQMLAHGSYGTYMIYPPGFSALTAVVCRLSGLTPLALFPVLAPSLLVLTTLAAYAVATRVWGWQYGLAAAALSGLVLRGAYASFAEGRYPDLTAAYFLLVMLVAALITLLASPSVRSGALFAVTGASVVLYHSVASLYLALLLAAVTVVAGGYLLLRRHADGVPRLARVLALALAALGVLAVGYAAYTYLPGKSGAGGSGTSTAVSIALGSQPVLSVSHVLTELSSSVVWLGVLGLAALAAGLRYLRQPAQVLTALTLVLWCLLMYAGSRTAADGFPQRFERDLGAALSILGALGAGLILRSLAQWRAPGRLAGPVRMPAPGRLAAPAVAAIAGAGTAAAAATAAGAVIALTGVQSVHAALDDTHAVHTELLDPQVAAAGAWLGRHNTGGTIISTPGMNPGITNRAVLAMGGYTGLQSYSAYRILHPRSLPAAGRAPLLDSREVLLHPDSCRSASIFAGQDVRYVVLYRLGDAADLAGFRADPARYRRVFENPSVVIYATSHTPGSACP